MLLTVVVIGVVLALLALVLGLALAAAADGADERDADAGVLAILARTRSPSGRPFFGSRESVQDLIGSLEEARREGVGPRRGEASGESH